MEINIYCNLVPMWVGYITRYRKKKSIMQENKKHKANGKKGKEIGIVPCLPSV